MLLALLVPEPGGPRAALRDRLADGIAIVLALGYGSVMLVLGDATVPGAALAWPADAALGLGCAGALLLRRRYPLRVAVALLPCGAVSVLATGPITVALFTAAIRFRAPLVLALGAVNVATGAVYHLLHDRPAFDMWADFAMRAVVTAAALGWGLFTQAYRRLTASLRERADQMEQQARLTERARIAREMHDVLAHRMSLISLHAGALEVRATVSPQELATAAGAIRVSAGEALEELRAVVGVPRGRPEPPQPGLADVPDLVESARAAGMAVELITQVPVDGPPVLLGRTAYRIVQEGLTNARKHGAGPAASVRLAGEAGRGLRITIVNPLPGTGEAPARDGGRGLVGIGERVALAGGTVRYGTDRGSFTLEASLPWPT